MNLLEAALRHIVGDLDALGVRWAIVGGLAVSARAEPRTTRDVDVAVAVTCDEEAEAVVHALQGRGYLVRTVVEHAGRKRLATARLVRATPPEVLIDLLFASSGIEEEVVSGAERLEILPDFMANVATVGHLLALKILARDDRARPQDLDDIRALLREATATDLDVARAAVRLIAQRGFARDRALVDQLDAVVTDPRHRSGSA
ncbi:MAG: nucleotidyl transferase AbiEii/AbiGii toxin family protein [Candidatus Binatia bacterium]